MSITCFICSCSTTGLAAVFGIVVGIMSESEIGRANLKLVTELACRINTDKFKVTIVYCFKEMLPLAGCSERPGSSFVHKMVGCICGTLDVDICLCLEYNGITVLVHQITGFVTAEPISNSIGDNACFSKACGSGNIQIL